MDATVLVMPQAVTDSDFFSGNDEDFYFQTETDEEEYFESFLQSGDSDSSEYASEDEDDDETTEEDSDYQEQNVIVRRDLNEYTEPNGQCRLLLVSLLDNFCSLYDRNPAKNQKLFSLLCRKLYSMGILKSLDFMEESRALRSIYKEAFKAIVLEAVKSAEISAIEATPSIPGSPGKSGRRESLGSPLNNSVSASNNSFMFNAAGHSSDSTGTSAVAAEDVFLSGRSRYREDFIEGRVLGRGGYGKVVLAENRLDGFSYAVKKIQFAGLSSQRYTRILREVKSLARLDHANIVRYHSAWIEDHAVILELIEEEDAVGVHKHTRSKSVPNNVTTATTTTTTGHGHSHSLYHLQDRKIMYIQMEMCAFTLEYYLKQRNAFYVSLAAESKQLGHLPLGRELVLRDKTDRSIALPAEQLFYWSQEEEQLHLRPGELDRIFKGIVKGLHYIHEHGMIHRDLKPMNIFFQLSDEGELMPKIGDFGLVSENALPTGSSSGSSSSPSASESEQEPADIALTSIASKTMGIGTVTYAAPEQLSQQDYTQKSDIYSLGIIAFELFHPTATQMERVRLLDELKRQHRFPDEFLKRWPKEAAFIWSCIARDASLRPSTREILESEWLDRDAEETMSQLAGENRMLRDLLRDREEQIRLLQERLSLLEIGKDASDTADESEK